MVDGRRLRYWLGTLLAGAVSGAVADSSAELVARTDIEITGIETADIETIVVIGRGWDVTSGAVVIDGSALGASGPSRSIDLVERVPALQVEVTTPRLARYAIRGIGSSSFNDGIESSVGMTVDGVHLGRQGMFLTDSGDLERIEILRGPQGTLSGKNNSAGVIHVTTRQPTFVPEAGVDLSVGSDSLREVGGFLSGPLWGDSLAGRLTFNDRVRDGLIHNVLDGRDYNNEQRQHLRGQLLWMPSPQLSARLIAEVSRQDEDCCAFTVTQYSASSRTSADFIGYQLPAVEPLHRAVVLDTANSNDVRQRALTLHLDAPLGSGDHGLASITAWRDWSVSTTLDLDGIGLAVAPYGGHDLMHRQFSQELRLSGALDERLEYVTGAYHFEQRLERNAWMQYGRHAADWFAGAVPALQALGITANQIDDSLLDGRRIMIPGQQESHSQALYGQLIWSPTSRLQLRPGLRYSWERKSGSVQRETSGQSPLPTDPINQVVGNLLNAALGQAYQHQTRLREGHWSGQLAISYRFSAQQLGYARWSRGIKSGGINAEPISGGVEPTFDAERVSMLELGWNQQFWSGRGSLQLALFDSTVADYQALTYSPAALGSVPQRNNLMNVGAVSSRGVELDTSLQLDDRVGVRFATTWNDAHYRDFANAPCPPASSQVLCDLGGERLAGAPIWSVVAGIDADYPLRSGRRLNAALDYHWRSGFYGTLERGPGSYQAGRGVVNARLGLSPARGEWEASLWVRNLFDEKYLSAIYALTGSGDYGAIVGDPRTMGATLRLRY